MYTLLYIRLSLWCLVVILGGCHRWSDSRWLPSVEWSSVAAIGGEVLGGGSLVILGGCHPGALPDVSAASILQPGTPGGYARHSSARRVLSRLNQSCRVRLIDAITLIINYLDAPFGCAFVELFVC